MPFPTFAAAICFIACHGGPADHFAAFTEELAKDNSETIEIIATGPALKKFEERGIPVTVPFSLDRLSPEEEDVLAEKIAQGCSTASVVITDLGHPFDIKIQKALARHAINVLRLAYYDNPEPYVPGGYSAVAAEVMQATQGVLFANSNLALRPIFQTPGKEVDFGNRKRVGIGYYPIQQADKIAKRRIKEKSALRKRVFEKYGLVDKGQSVLVYFGGNNEEYFNKALRAFLALLENGISELNFEDYIIVFQQHPGAKAKNVDRSIVEEWIQGHASIAQAPRIIWSDFSSDNAQTMADAALYYQTSMGPQFVLADIPAIQIGHETYADILVRNGLCPSVTTVYELIKAINDLHLCRKGIQRAVIFEGLGIKANWPEIVKAAIN